MEQIGISLRITREDGQPAGYHEFPWDFALLAEGAKTAFGGASIGSREDGSILYTAHVSIDGQTDRLLLIPVDTLAHASCQPDAVMENGAPLTEEQQQMQIIIELQP